MGVREPICYSLIGGSIVYLRKLIVQVEWPLICLFLSLQIKAYLAAVGRYGR